jgi:hypothetical protein
MVTKKFRAEFLIEKRVQGWVHERPISVGDMGAPTFEVVFRDTADGKHYAMHYYRDLDVGVDTFDGAKDDDLYECYEVEKKEVVTVDWERV